MPPRRNKGKSSGNTRCPGCGVHYKDINRHVRRKHNKTLSILKRQVAQRERSYQTRILRNQKLNAPKEDELIFDAEIQ
ncbi:32865_t:CDS:2 [Gigaspora margarita]|uniref:32865_t:CDS:1 n=1 Tax=Gigaspora margarita TaxID=4874 RepID=A0ABN7V5W6_GIGMA|nr:32865_t:CDS:2 [Gigaspora margarita]